MVQTFLRVVLFGQDIDEVVPPVSIKTRKYQGDPWKWTEMPIS